MYLEMLQTTTSTREKRFVIGNFFPNGFELWVIRTYIIGTLLKTLIVTRAEIRKDHSFFRNLFSYLSRFLAQVAKIMLLIMSSKIEL